MTVSGHYRWVALAAAVIFQASTFAFMAFCFAFWVQPWASEFDVSITEVMFIMTSVLLVLGSCSAIVGRLIDRHPINYIVTIGVLLMAAGFWLASHVQTYIQMFAVYGVLLPLASSLTATLASQSVAVKWFDGHKQLGLAMGVAAMGVSVGGIVWPPLVEAGVAEHGWRWVFQRAALMQSLVLAPLMFFVLMPRPPTNAESDSATADADQGGATSAGEQEVTNIPLKRLLTNRYFLIPISAFFLDAVSFNGFQTNSKVYLESIGVEGGAGAAISLLSTVMLLAKLLMGKLTDWLHYRTLFVLAGLCNCFALLIFALGNPSLVNVGIVLIGLGAGGLIPLQAKIINFHFGAAHFGQVFGIFIFLQTMGVLGSPLLSAMYEAFGSYREPFLILIGVVVVAIMLMISLRKDRPYEPLTTS